MEESNFNKFWKYTIFKNIFLQLIWTFTKYIDFID
jgi:hypothetical protein